jgi:hypothetical protein
MIIWVICILHGAHLISSSGPPANVQLHDHDAQHISIWVCFPLGCMAFPRSHNVCDVCDMLRTNSDLQWSHLKERNCKVGNLWLFCLFIDRRVSDSPACRLNRVALCTFTLWKWFSQEVKQERKQNMKTHSRRSRELDPFPDTAYSLSTGRATD